MSAWSGTWQLAPIHTAILILVLHQITLESPPSALKSVSRRLLVIMNVAAALTVISAVVTWSAAGAGERSVALVAGAGAMFFFVATMVRLLRARRVGSPPSSSIEAASPRRAAN
jgi:hypothetical protein